MTESLRSIERVHYPVSAEKACCVCDHPQGAHWIEQAITRAPVSIGGLTRSWKVVGRGCDHCPDPESGCEGLQ